MLAWTSHERQKLLSAESCKRFEAARQKPALFEDSAQLRGALLDFIADFANWDNSTVNEYLDSSRALTLAAHEALGGVPGTRPLVVDPFAGGGSIPLEALRVGADAFASDLNPVAVLLNKVVLEYLPKYGQRLADGVRKWGGWIHREAEKELVKFYPKDADGATPIAYLWARTIQCEGPGCGAKVPMLTDLWLAERSNSRAAMTIEADKKRKTIEVSVQTGTDVKDVGAGVLRRSSVTCSVCGFTTPADHVRDQFKSRAGGANDARLLAVVSGKDSERGKRYRSACDEDFNAVKSATLRMEEYRRDREVPSVPDEILPYLRSIFNIQLLGVKTWGQLFTDRQLLALLTLAKLVSLVAQDESDIDFGRAVRACLACALDRQADYNSSLCRWVARGEFIGNTFGRQALGIIWDFAEVNPFSHATGCWDGAVEWVSLVLDAHAGVFTQQGVVAQSSATAQPLPDDSASLVCTDPPYYDLVPYADLSDFFYVWLKRAVGHDHISLFTETKTPKAQEIVQLAERNSEYAYKTRENFEKLMGLAMEQSRRVINPKGVGVVFFAHKGTAAWETQLQAMINAGWIIVGSWPLATERAGRLRAMNSAVLASSIQLVCRPRKNPDGSLRTAGIGDWRDVLQELPLRIHEWMPRLAEEGVVGADAIFACLGPSLEIYSRYSRVEKASGESVTLKEYLEQVWAAVAKEALTLVFQGADATGFEADARLTAMWLWTLRAGDADEGGIEEDEGDDGSEGGEKKSKTGGFMLEYDAARKIAQGLGAHLEDLASLVEVDGEQARLLSVGERARYLFGKDEGRVTSQRKKREAQMDLFTVLQQADGEGTSYGETKVERQGTTVLDRIHQSMILFAAGRGEALKRFLVEDGAGRDQRFWRLAQALSALYPSHIEEKRWVDGVLARKKGLGF
jgi:putative DNA methylase